jgi:DNA polymerase-3 subunit gamma/tau
MALYRKWRPASFDEVVGQEHVVRTLRNAITSGRIHHAYLFSGPRGTGKTTTARLLAKAVNCLAPKEQRPCNACAICQAVNEGRLLDLIEIDAASNTGVDDVRELRERVGFRPTEAEYKVYVIDEVHMLSNAAFNALLKTLEEPPSHTIFVLATTEVGKIPATVLSRCQRFDFRRIPLSQIVARLEWLTQQEGIRADRDALTLIARYATGSMRDAESLLDQLASYSEGGITVEGVQAVLGSSDDAVVVRVVEALCERDVAGGLDAINAAIDEGADPRRFARQIVEHLRALLLLQLKSAALPVYVSDEARPYWESRAASLPTPMLTRAVRLFNAAASETAPAWQPQLPLELAFVEATLPSPPPAASAPSGEGVGQAPRASAAAPTAGTAVAATDTSNPRAPSRVQETAPGYPSRAHLGQKLTLETLRNLWDDFLNALRPRNLPLEALVRSCSPVAVENDVVTLGFEYDYSRGRAAEERNKRDMEDALCELVGERYRVQCVVLPQGHVTPMTRSEAAAVETTLADDPVVQTAIQLGGQVIHHSAGPA